MRYPAVVLYMDIWGLREELFDIARNLAAIGYYVLVPDLYHRQGRIRGVHVNEAGRMISFHHLDAARQQVALQPMKQLTVPMVLEDTAAIIDFVGKENAVRPGPMGCFGYCLGGRLILYVAGTFPERFKASAGMHGSDLATGKPDSPHRVARNAQGEIYMGFAALDPFAKPEVRAALAESFEGCAFRYHPLLHEKVQHGYALPERDIYNKRAALIDWEHILAMFHRQIPPGYAE